MASITIRNLDGDVKSMLRVRAAGNGRSMEEEARLILRDAVGCRPSSHNLADIIRQHFGPSKGGWIWSCHRAMQAASRRPSIEGTAMILLDTNVVSELMRTSPDPAAEASIAGHPVKDLFFSAVGESELR